MMQALSWAVGAGMLCVVVGCTLPTPTNKTRARLIGTWAIGEDGGTTTEVEFTSGNNVMVRTKHPGTDLHAYEHADSWRCWSEKNFSINTDSYEIEFLSDDELLVRAISFNAQHFGTRWRRKGPSAAPSAGKADPLAEAKRTLAQLQEHAKGTRRQLDEAERARRALAAKVREAGVEKGAALRNNLAGQKLAGRLADLDGEIEELKGRLAALDAAVVDGEAVLRRSKYKGVGDDDLRKLTADLNEKARSLAAPRAANPFGREDAVNRKR
jgi:hypothetical protein